MYGKHEDRMGFQKKKKPSPSIAYVSLPDYIISDSGLFGYLEDIYTLTPRENMLPLCPTVSTPFPTKDSETLPYPPIIHPD
jgi:hypothetical protein